jgi:pimeloyl-ACP methyl ester carboxylesterase
MRIRMEVAEQRAPVFRSIEEYAEMLSLNYPAGQRGALLRMARYALRQRPDGKYELKMDPSLRDGMALRESEDSDAAQAERVSVQRQWAALAALPCPALVVRGAASDILAAEVADRMADEVLKQGRLAVVPRAAHSVMTDNPDGFNQAVCAFVLAE